jgi:hypothetical protein
MEPATKRGLPGVRLVHSRALSRATRAAATFISKAVSSSPYSDRTMRVAPKVLVSAMSAPASK